jgi:outer membrane protein, heavy metal efflux system
MRLRLQPVRTCWWKRAGVFWAVIGSAMMTSASARADDGAPSVLTLQAALSTPLQQQYGVMGAEADLLGAKADQQEVQSWYDPTVSIEGRLRYIKPNNAAPDPNTRHDNALGISARQRLFDFGRQSLRADAAKAGVTGAQLQLFSVEQAQRLAILKAFFAVLLADQSFTTLDERMAIVYVRFDKAKDRKELGMASDYDLAGLQREYEDVLLARAKADAERRISRRKLSELMGTPNQIPSKLVSPKLTSLFARKPPELDVALKRALADDPELQALKARYESAEQSLRAARDHNAPTIYAQVNGDYYQRELGSRDPFQAGVYIDFPLYDGRLRDAKIGKAQAERMRLSAQVAAREADLRDQMTHVIEMIEVYRKPALSRVKALENYSDLNFTRKQTLYQMEKATDLGDAMVEGSAAQLERMRTSFALATYWAELASMQGQPIDSIFTSAPTVSPEPKK